MKAKFILTVTACAISVLAYAVYPGMKPLTGDFDITGKTAVDALPSEPRDTHFRVHLSGDAAKALYDHMKVDPVSDWCAGTTTVKLIDSMACSFDSNEYECWFAIDIANQAIDGGWTC